MQEKITINPNIVIAVVALLVLVGGGYYWYSSSQDDSAQTATAVDSTLFTKDVAAFYEAKDAINLKDTAFLTKDFYANLKNYTSDIPTVPPTGRPNPFIPYAAP